MATLDDALAALDDSTESIADTQSTPSYAMPAPRPAPAKPATGTLDDALDVLEQPERADQLRGTVELGSKQDPARSTKILQLFGKTGLPRDFIERNQAFVEQESAKQEFNPDKLMKDSPAFASWLSEHPDHVSAAKPDLQALSLIEKQLRNIPAQFEKGQQTVEYGDVMLGVVQGLLNKTDVTGLRKRQAELEAAMSKPDPTGLADETGMAGIAQRAPGWMAQQLPILSRTLQEQVKSGATGVAVGALGGAAVGGLPGAAAGGLAVGAASWRVGAAVSSAKMEFAQAFGEYEKLKDEQGNNLDQATAMGLAGMVGVVNGSIDGFFGIEGLTSKLPGINQFTRDGIKELLRTPTTRAAVLSYARTVGQVMATEGVTEAIQMYITKAGGVALQAVKDGGAPADWLGKIFTAENLEQAATEAEAGAFGGGGIASVMATPGLAGDISKVREANKAKQAFESIGKATEGAKFAQDLPDSLKDIISRATKDGPIEQVYVPSEAFNTYFQKEGVDPRAVYQEITGNVEAYDQASQTGADLPINTADYAVKLAGTKHNAFFAQELRADIDAMNAREAEQWVKDQDAHAEAEAAAIAQPGLQTLNAGDPAAQVRKDISGQLQAAGFDPTVVDQYAGLFESRYRARAERRGLGETAADLFRQNNLSVTRPVPEILRTLGGKTSELDALLNRLRVGDLPKPQEVFGQSLMEFLKSKGGLQDQGGELSARNIDQARQPFKKNLVQKKGMTLDEAAQRAVEAGYLEARDIPKLLDALDQEARGTPVFALGKENTAALDVQNNLESLKAYLDQKGIDLATATNADIKKLFGEATQQTLPGEEVQTFAQGGQTDTAAFLKWFGDSKVVDEHGKPLVVYHGTKSDIEVFDASKTNDAGFHFGAEPQAKMRAGKAQIPVYLKIENPKRTKDDGGNWKKKVAAAKSSGHDGIIYLNRFEGIPLAEFDAVRATGKNLDTMSDAEFRKAVPSAKDSYIAFQPTQIKSSTGNAGTFDPKNPNILYQGGQTDTEDPFFSQAERVIVAKMPNKASAAQIKGILSPDNGVKPDELKWMGMDDFLKTKESFTKEEVLAFITANQVQVQEVTKGERRELTEAEARERTRLGLTGKLTQKQKERYAELSEIQMGSPTKFESYQLPGGTNYRELLLTLPANKQSFEEWQKERGYDETDNVGELAERRRRYDSGTNPDTGELKPTFTSSHFSEPNILAHVRFNDRIVDGKKVLFLEEVQSDWHQKGKKQGYGEALTKEERRHFNEMTVRDLSESERPLYFDYQRRLRRDGVPDAPFKKTWHELALKRMLRYSAEHGYDSMAWTTGEQQAERYDLSKYIEDVTLHGSGENMRLSATDKSGRKVIDMQHVTSSTLADHIGKEAAEKILAQPEPDIKNPYAARNLFNADLKVGGEGMKGFYDQILPAFMNKYGKKWGAKVGETTIETPPTREQGDEPTSEDGLIRQKVHSLPITESMKESVLHEGQPLFQSGDKPKGSITFGDNQINIKLLEKADLSTFIHETGHLYLNELIADATTPGVSPQLGADLDTVLKWMGLDVTSASGADAIKGAIKTKHHEQFARGFEAYAMEGKSPSQAMREAFATFRQWLIQAYRSLTTAPLNVKLTKDVREVLDRMIATDEEIDRAAEEAEVFPLFTNAISAGMSPTQFAAYQETVKQASLTARETLQKKLMAQYQRKHEKWWKTELEATRLKVLERVDALPEYVALSVLQTGTMPDGSALPAGVEPMKLDRKAVADQFGQDFLTTMPQGTMRKGGMHPDTAAPVFGFNSGQELVMAMVNARPKRELIDAEADQQMQDKYGDMRFDGSIAEAARAAVMSEHQEQVIAAEIRALNAKAREVKPFVKAAEEEAKTAQKAGKALLRTMIPSLEDTRTLARNILARMTLKKMNPYSYSVAARQASKRATEALASQDYIDAGLHKQRELLNLAMFREALIIKEQIEKTHDLASNFAKADSTLAKSRNVDLINVGRAILAQYGLGPESDKTAAEHLDPIKNYDKDLYDQWKPQVDALAPRPLDYNALTVEEFTKLSDDLKALWLLSLRTQQIKVNGELVDRNEVIDELSAVMASFTKQQKDMIVGAQTPWADTKLGLLSWKSALSRVESWVDAMDSGDINGVFRKVVWTPISEASNQFRAGKKDLIQKYLAIINPIEGTITRDLIPAPELGPGVSFRGKTALLHAVLHTGNESNQSKLLRGYKWDASNWQTFLDRMHREKVLTKADYDYAQGVWDLLESIKPQAQQAHHEMYGYYFNEITAKELATPFGKYKGGYVPAIADRVQSVDQAIREEKNIFDQAGNSFNFPTTGRGATKSRIEEYAAPLALDLTAIPLHLDWVMRFSFLEPRVKDAARLITNKRLRSALDAMDSTAAKDMLVPWLQRSAQQTVSTPGRNRHADRMFRYLRKTSGAQIMVGNVINTLQQLTGFSLTLTKVKARYMRGAMVNYLRHPSTYAEDIAERSAFMKGRTSTQVIEIQQTIDDILLNPTMYEKARKFAERHGYFMQQGTQSLVDLITWGAAYDQAHAQKLDDTMAVRAADAAVRQTQGSFAPEDISNFEAGTPFTRAFTMFYSYFNMQANLLGTEFGKVAHGVGLRKGAGRAFYLYFVGFMIPAVLAETIVKGIGGFDPDDDEDYLNEALSIFFGSQIRSALAFFPGVGPITLAGVNAFNDKWYDDRISTSPVVSLLESAVRAPHSVYKAMADEGHSKRAVKDVLTLVGLITGLPVGSLSKPLGYLADVADDKAQPEDVGDVARGLLSGKNVNRTK